MGRAEKLSTAAVCDACARLDIPVRLLPSSVRPLRRWMRATGRALPVKHQGSVDAFLLAIGRAEPGDVMVIDNGGRMDESCIGDLVALEAKQAGLGGIVVWGAHRDSRELDQIELPVFSCGSNPMGPRRGTAPLAKPGAVRLGDIGVARDDFVMADHDGVVVLALESMCRALPVAESISRIERDQAFAICRGTSLREQLRFEEYVSLQADEPSYTFRVHLARIGGAIEV